MKASKLVEEFGGTYSKALGIDLASGKADEIYKWFIAAILFGARISEAIATNTYREFEQAGTISPKRMLDAGWNGLVKILDRGGYVRYDFKTATKLLEVNNTLMQQYKGDLNALHHAAKDASDLEQRLMNLGKGIGEVTVNIFLRELRGIWRKAAPAPSEPVIHAANELGVLPKNIKDGTRIMDILVAAWREDGMRLKEFPDFEAALVRYGKVLRKKNRVAHAHRSG